MKVQTWRRDRSLYPKRLWDVCLFSHPRGRSLPSSRILPTGRIFGTELTEMKPQLLPRGLFHSTSVPKSRNRSTRLYERFGGPAYFTRLRSKPAAVTDALLLQGPAGRVPLPAWELKRCCPPTPASPAVACCPRLLAAARARARGVCAAHGAPSGRGCAPALRLRPPQPPRGVPCVGRRPQKAPAPARVANSLPGPWRPGPPSISTQRRSVHARVRMCLRRPCYPGMVVAAVKTPHFVIE